MASTPRQSLPDDFAAGAVCAVCGAAALRLAHLKSFPDYVACDNCKASFVAEDGGERVLYGNIPEAYPLARSLALRKWATLAQVAAVAQRERPSPPRPVSVPIPIGSELDRDAPLRAAASAGVPIPTQPEIARPPTRSVPLGYEEEVEEQPEQEEEDEMPAEMERDAPLGRLSRLMAGAPEPEPMADWAGSLVPERVPTAPPPAEAIPPAPTAVAPAATAAAKPAAPAPAVPAARPAAQPPDPIPGQRFRVIVRGDRVVFPMQSCAHCTHSPAPNRLTVVASVAQGQTVGRQRPTRYSVPLCRACYRRATARSAEGQQRAPERPSDLGAGSSRPAGPGAGHPLDRSGQARHGRRGAVRSDPGRSWLRPSCDGAAWPHRAAAGTGARATSARRCWSQKTRRAWRWPSSGATRATRSCSIRPTSRARSRASWRSRIAPRPPEALSATLFAGPGMPSRTPFGPRAPSRRGETAGVPPGIAARTVPGPSLFGKARSLPQLGHSSPRANPAAGFAKTRFTPHEPRRARRLARRERKQILRPARHRRAANVVGARPPELAEASPLRADGDRRGQNRRGPASTRVR